MATYDYDMLVIGSGPAGQRAAIQAAKLDKRVAVVERRAVVGGVSVNLGTIPSKTLREAVLDLSGIREKEFYGESYAVKQNITMADLTLRTDKVIRHEIDQTRLRLARNQVELISARASFVDAHTLDLESADGTGTRRVTAAVVMIAVGTEATKDPGIPFDGQRIFTSDEIFALDRLPRTLAVIGAGVIGCEYASMFAALGVRVTLRLNEAVSRLETIEDEHGARVRIHLESGKQIVAEKALYSIGRTGATSGLNLEAAGLGADHRGRLNVNENYQTAQPHIYAAGDIIGFPALASTSMEQGRLAACCAFGVRASSVPALFPYGIYAIPEISMVGKNEEELTQEGVSYEVGKARYKEIARGQIIGDVTGLLKLIFHAETRELLGVHIIGEGASELVHIGQAVMSFGGKIDYFINTVFNYPTLAECYKNAAFDGLNRLGIPQEQMFGS